MRTQEKDTVTNLDDFVLSCINGVVELGGSLVSEEEYDKRIEICKGCENYGFVKLAGISVVGCTNCGCPSATKPRYKTYFSFKK